MPEQWVPLLVVSAVLVALLSARTQLRHLSPFAVAALILVTAAAAGRPWVSAGFVLVALLNVALGLRALRSSRP